MSSIARSLCAAIATLCIVSSAADAARVTWRASGVVTSVGSYLGTLPFTPMVGQAFVIDMVLETSAASVTCNSYGPNVLSCNNIFSATVYVGNNQMIFTPSTPWSTTLWNDYVIGPSPLDYYNMPIVDAATQWEARWTVQTPVANGTTGPMTSLSMLQTPPDVTAFQGKEMALTPGAGNYAPTIVASLNSVVVVGANAPNPTLNASDSGGGGHITVSLMLLMAACACLRYTAKRKG